MAMLEREGFAPSGLVDVFDGGPTVTCQRDHIASLRTTRRIVATVVDRAEGVPRLLSTDALSGFRSTRAAVDVHPDGVSIDRATATALQIEDGMTIRVRL